MYQLLSLYYDKLFNFNPKLKDFIFAYASKAGSALDLGCGTGRLTETIFKLDMHVTGIDLDLEMVEKAKKNFPHIPFKQKDMIEYLNMPNHHYDLITCFGNTIAHLDLVSLNRLFSLTYLHLNQDKYFVIQLLNYAKILKEKPDSLPDLENDDLLLKRNYVYFKNHILFETILFKDDDVFELGATTLYPYTHMFLIDIAKQCGFQTELYGKPDFSPYQYDDSHVYLVFKKV